MAGSRELWLIRDRIGIKPLYYSVHHGRLTFASEIKALLRIPQQRGRFNEESSLPLPVVPDDAGAADAVRRHPQAAVRDWMLRVHAMGAPPNDATGMRGTTSTPLDGASDEDEIAERVLAELRVWR